MPLPEGFLELIPRGFKGFLISVMGSGTGEIWARECPEPNVPLIAAGFLHNPAGLAAINENNVVLARCGEGLAPGVDPEVGERSR